MIMEITSRDAQMRLGKRYGNMANRPSELNNDGKFSAGCEKIPPREATQSVHNTKFDIAGFALTADDCSNTPYKWHDGICPWFVLGIPDQLTYHGLYHP